MADISAIKALDGVTYSIKDSEARDHLVPASGTTGQVLTKTASGYGWADASGGGTAEYIMYDNSTSGLEAVNVQEAIDELNKVLIVQFPSTGWTTTETVNSTTYYTQTVSVSSVSSDHPEVGIVPITGTLPTSAEQDAFNSVEYFTVNRENNTLKGYATSAPSDTFAVVVKGVA